MVTCFHRKTIIQELCQIIEQARGQVAATANYAQTMMYWNMGERINREVLGNQRAEYGKQIVSAVSTQLQEEYGKKGFESRSIWRMMQFATLFPDFQMSSSASLIRLHIYIKGSTALPFFALITIKSHFFLQVLDAFFYLKVKSAGFTRLVINNFY